MSYSVCTVPPIDVEDQYASPGEFGARAAINPSGQRAIATMEVGKLTLYALDDGEFWLDEGGEGLPLTAAQLGSALSHLKDLLF